MALVVFDRVQETTATTGTGTITLGGAVTGYQSFAVVGDGNTTFYCITNGAQWEVGIGTYTSSGTTLSRDTVLSNSNGNTSPITLSGSSVVFVTYPAEKSVNLNASGNVTALGTIASGTWQGSTIGVAYGGTGVTSSSGANSVVLRDSNANVIFNNFIAGFTAVTAAAGTTVLTVASTRTQVLVGSTTQTIQLPDATTLQLGHSFIFVNNSSGVLTITNSASATIDLVPSGGAVQLGATSIATVAGTWGIYSFLPGTYNFSIPTADFGNATITNAVWNGTTIGSAYGGTGLTTFTAANNALFSTSASALTAGTLPILAGGTGATTDSGARTNLGLGTIATQNANAVAITGGSINGTTIGATTASTGAFSTLSATGVTTVQAGTVSAPAITTSGDTNTGIFFPAADTIAFTEGGVESMRITDTGRVGIGTDNPSYKLDVYDASNAFSALRGDSSTQFIVQRASTDATGGFIQFYKSRGTQASPTIVADDDITGRMVFYGYDGTSFTGSAEIRGSIAGAPGASDMPGRLGFFTTPDGSASLTERMRILSSGTVLIGTTADNGTGGLSIRPDQSAGALQLNWNRATTASASTVLVFRNAGTAVGNINHNNTATTYATSSDYRLKENIAPMTGALATVAQLKPVTYNWKIDGSDGQGFIAHELQAVIPQCVTGDKDAVDSEGNPINQGIDTSFLVATLTAAIQELKSTVDAQAARIAALEAG